MTDQDPTRIDARFDPKARLMNGTTVHGNLYFECPIITQLEGNLWVGGCEDGLILPDHFRYVLSLYKWEAYRAEKTQPMDERAIVKTITMYDSREGLDMDQVRGLAAQVNEWRDNEDGDVLVHCQAGLNRSAFIAGASLVLQGRDPAEVIDLMRRQRSEAVLCNPTFEKQLLGLTP